MGITFGTIALFVLLSSACASMSNRACTPERVTSLSAYAAYGRFEAVVPASSQDASSSASIRCNITGRDWFLRVEWILVGEPPFALSVEAENDLLSSLKESTITCMASDIPLIDRPGPQQKEKPYVNGTGTVSYQCKGTENLKIIFQNIMLLSKDLNKSHDTDLNLQSNVLLAPSLGTPATGNTVDDRCVNKSKMPKRGLSRLVGHACAGAKRRMYDESGQFTCAVCCCDHYWSKSDNQCQKCTGILTNLEPNVWTSCKQNRSQLNCTSTASSTTTEATTTATEPNGGLGPGSTAAIVLAVLFVLGLVVGIVAERRTREGATEPCGGFTPKQIVVIIVVVSVLTVVGFAVGFFAARCWMRAGH